MYKVISYTKKKNIVLYLVKKNAQKGKATKRFNKIFL